MKRIILYIALCISTLGMTAQLPSRVSRTLRTFKSAPAVTAVFELSGRHGSLTVCPDGCYRMEVNGTIYAFDGTTNYNYDPDTRELTRYKPTPEEAADSPVAFLLQPDRGFKGSQPMKNVYRLTPGKPTGDIAEITLTYPDSGVWPSAATIVTGQGATTFTGLKFTPVKTKPARSTFQLKAPEGAIITDL